MLSIAYLALEPTTLHSLYRFGYLLPTLTYLQDFTCVAQGARCLVMVIIGNNGNYLLVSVSNNSAVG